MFSLWGIEFQVTIIIGAALLNFGTSVYLYKTTNTGFIRYCKRFASILAVGEDYSVPAGYQSSGLLDATTIEECRTVNIINDASQEDRESFLFRLTLSGGQFDVIGNFQVSVPTTEVVILDDDAPSGIVT